jgi:hypothetical protein
MDEKLIELVGICEELYGMSRSVVTVSGKNVGTSR